MVAMKYGLEWDRDYFIDFLYWNNSFLTVLSSLTIYPANFYLLLYGPAMSWEIRLTYLANLIANIACDWIFTIIVRAYAVSPFGLYYCEGILSFVGAPKQLIMGFLAFGIITIICTFYILMMRMHQLTVASATSRWKLSTEAIIYASTAAMLIVNLCGFVVFGTDVDNYDKLVMEPELAWMVERGGTLLLFSEPGKENWFRIEIVFLLICATIFLPFLLFFVLHALIYLRNNVNKAISSKTQLLTHRLFSTFQFQMRGAIIFFIGPLAFILTTSVVDVSGIVPGPAFAVLRFISLMLLELYPAQFGLFFIFRNATHRHLILRRIQRITFVANFRKQKHKLEISQPAVTWISTDT